jgi:tetratricopeptide (TPR) repeat protein
MTIDRLARLLAMLDAEPRDTFCLYGVAQEHVKRGAPEEALRWFEKTIEIDPDHAYAWFHKAKVLSGTGRTPEAVAALRQGLAAARRSGDGKAIGEIEGWLEELNAA